MLAPAAVSVVLEPAQMAMFGLTVTTGIGFTVTGIVVTGEEHPFTITIKVTFFIPAPDQLT